MRLRRRMSWRGWRRVIGRWGDGGWGRGGGRGVDGFVALEAGQRVLNEKKCCLMMYVPCDVGVWARVAVLLTP